MDGNSLNEKRFIVIAYYVGIMVMISNDLPPVFLPPNVIGVICMAAGWWVTREVGGIFMLVRSIACIVAIVCFMCELVFLVFVLSMDTRRLSPGEYFLYCSIISASVVIPIIVYLLTEYIVERTVIKTLLW